MAFKYTTIGPGLERDHENTRAEVVEAFELGGGNVNRAAHYLAVSRRQLYRYLWRYDLWAELDTVRAAAMAAFLEARARLKLKPIGDDHGRDEPRVC